jgi:hypothetical protein
LGALPSQPPPPQSCHGGQAATFGCATVCHAAGVQSLRRSAGRPARLCRSRDVMTRAWCVPALRHEYRVRRTVLYLSMRTPASCHNTLRQLTCAAEIGGVFRHGPEVQRFCGVSLSRLHCGALSPMDGGEGTAACCYGRYYGLRDSRCRCCVLRGRIFAGGVFFSYPHTGTHPPFTFLAFIFSWKFTKAGYRALIQRLPSCSAPCLNPGDPDLMLPQNS